MAPAIRIFSTCPPSTDASGSIVSGAPYRARVADVGRWSEAAGCEGILVYADNRLVDPWLVSQIIVEATDTLSPLVAVQPVYTHPYTVAKMVASFAHLYGRKIYLNMVAGGFKRDLEALNDFTPHDERYTRLQEYSQIIKDLCAESHKNIGVSFSGTYYSVDSLKLTPAVPPELMPELFVSGSSEAGLNAAANLDGVAIHYPRPASEYRPDAVVHDQKRGIRIGIVARETADEAWQVAEERFPSDRRGQIAHKLAMKTSDSSWHKELSERPEMEGDPESPYWLRPFHSYQTFCPYLVGRYDRVAKEIAGYIAAGFDTFILDIPPSEFELSSIRHVFDTARGAAV